MKVSAKRINDNVNINLFILLYFTKHKYTLFLMSIKPITINWKWYLIATFMWGLKHITDWFVMYGWFYDRPELIAAVSFLVAAGTDCFLWDSSANKAPSALFIRPAFNFSSTLFMPVQHTTHYIKGKIRSHIKCEKQLMHHTVCWKNKSTPISGTSNTFLVVSWCVFGAMCLEHGLLQL